MTKKNQITLRTTITVTIAGSLALTGVFYAASPSIFAPVPPVFDHEGNGLELTLS